MPTSAVLAGIENELIRCYVFKGSVSWPNTTAVVRQHQPTLAQQLLIAAF
jgi:hypothetical protein